MRGIVSELERAFDSAESTERSGSIFCAMAHLMSVAIGTGAALESTGVFTEVGKRLRSGIVARLLKHETTLRFLIRAMLLHPMLSVADLGSVDEAFASIAAEEERQLRVLTAIGDTRVANEGIWGLRRCEDEDEYSAFKRIRLSECPNVTRYWLGQTQWPKLRLQALELAAIPATTGDVERVFSTARATFDYFMGRLSPKELERRLMAKVNSRLLRRFCRGRG